MEDDGLVEVVVVECSGRGRWWRPTMVVMKV